MTEPSNMAEAYIFAKVYDTERKRDQAADSARVEATAAVKKFRDYMKSGE